MYYHSTQCSRNTASKTIRRSASALFKTWRTCLSVITLTSWLYSMTATTKGTIRMTWYFSACGIWPLQDLYAAGEGSGKMTKTSLLPRGLHLLFAHLHMCWRMVTGPSKNRKIPLRIYRQHNVPWRCQNVALFRHYRGCTCWLICSKFVFLSRLQHQQHWTQLTSVSKESMRVYSFTNYLTLLGIRKITVQLFLHN